MVPKLCDIVAKEVVCIEQEASIDDAVLKMAELNARDIVVIDNANNDYYLLNTNTLINLKIKGFDFTQPLKNAQLQKIKKFPKNLSVISALDALDKDDEYFCIVTEDNKLTGIVSFADIVTNVDPKLMFRKRKVKHILFQHIPKKAQVEQLTADVIKELKNSASDSIIVYKDDKPVGIFTTKDIILLLHKKKDLNVPIGKYMSKPLVMLPKEATIKEALEFIQKRNFKRIVLSDKDGQVAGVVTQKELLRQMQNKWLDFVKKKEKRLSAINKELQKKAERDFLTKIYNRQKFEDFIEYEINKANRYKSKSFSILLADLDDFKRVNDTYGHMVGDETLKQFANILSQNIRSSDILARWGGEEFVIILPFTSLEEAYATGEKLRKRVESHNFAVIKKITCSIGVATYQKNENKEELFERVDRALYKAKSLGKNRVEKGEE